ncbi:KxYKxGKxW signal peptide domain-containing protein [Convivina praedatoris]|uniref:Uncharacterized protein n=1 Tax=Convivina praedatoris TaxID=2880963 RepID=A0ABM9D3M7_9LACO|nr:KxYKxGKxW signal peptide domain-containing protein [Convivina sp. LMG 32447]CAH1853378.1 hypothetical protein R077815_00818 [Convivina sp. LMG 32447]CAH1854748.1 hypothetical protein LMG032447_00932 [Convivina sp. LMG 32447]
MNKQVKQHVKMFKAGKLWLTAGVVALGMGAATVAATSPVASADTAAVQAQQSINGYADGTYTMPFAIMETGSTQNLSQMQGIFANPATITLKGDQATLTLAPAGELSGTNATMYNNLVKTMTFNGKPVTASGNNISVTLPKDDFNKTIIMSVSALGSTQNADFHAVNQFTPVNGGSTSTSEAPKTSASASEAPKTSTASESQKPSASTSATPAPSTSAASTSTAAQSTEYKAEFKMVKENSSEASVMDKMFEKPAKVVYSADRKNVTLSFTFGNGSSFGDGNALSGMLKSWTFNGVEATRNGRVWSVTLPASAVKSPIDMKVTYFQSEEAKLVITNMTTMDGKAFDFKADESSSTTNNGGSTMPSSTVDSQSKTDSKSSAVSTSESGSVNAGTDTKGTSTSSAATTPVAHKGQQAPAAKTTTTSALPKTAQEAANNNTVAMILAALGLTSAVAYMTYRRKH